jgi:dihydrofolate reductase
VNDTPPRAAAPSEHTSLRTSPRIALIAAVARNGVIGSANRLPWRLPEDMARFRRLTLGHAVIMGRRTWESIGRPLPGRQNIVVTRAADAAFAGAQAAASLDDALAKVTLPEPAFVIGGALLYREALPRAARLYLTEIERDYEGDVRFPPLARAEWRAVSEHRHCAAAGGPGYTFIDYVRAA